MSSRGTTLVEALLALAIMGVAITAMLQTVMTLVNTNSGSEVRSGAVSAAETELEDLRLQDPALMPMSGSSSPKLVTVGDEAYELVTHFCERSELCETFTSRYLRVEVRSEGKKVYDVETIFTQLR